MRELLTPDDIYSEIVMRKNVDNSALLVVEGDSDQRALGSHISTKHADIMVGGSKTAVVKIITLTNMLGPPGVLAIVDRDYDTALGMDITMSNFAYTDYCDIESTILFSPSVSRRLVVAHFDTDRVNRYSAGVGVEFIEAVIHICSLIGILRLLSIREGLELRMRRFPVGEVLSAGGGDCDLGRLVELALQRSAANTLPEAELLKIMKLEMQSRRRGRELCNGHDLLAAVGSIGKAFLGRTHSVQALQNALLAAFDCVTLQGTRLHESVGQWAELNDLTVWDC